AFSPRRVQRRVELRGGGRADRDARPHARHSAVSAGTLRGTWHPILAEATGQSVVVSDRKNHLQCIRGGGEPHPVEVILSRQRLTWRLWRSCPVRDHSLTGEHKEARPGR